MSAGGSEKGSAHSGQDHDVAHAASHDPDNPAATHDAVHVQLPTASGPVPAYTVRPGTVAGAGVIVLQEAYGVNEHIRDVCHRFAAKGFLAVAPHLYHRTGDPELPYDDFAATSPHMQALARDDLVDDLDATLAWLDEQGFGLGRVGVVGFCMGGSIALFAAVTYPLGAAVSFYGGGVAHGRFGFPPLVELAPVLASPWLGLYGDNDHSIPAEQVEALRAAAKRADVPTEIVRYPDAGHGFHCDARPAAYSAAAAHDAWARTVNWLRRYLTTP